MMVTETRKEYQAVSGFSADVYMNAAKERQPLCNALYFDGEYVLAIYAAGLAVECMFRAYHARFSLEFDERHDLKAWAKKSKFMDLLPSGLDSSNQYTAAINTLYLLWQNSHRYRSEQSLRKWYRDRKADKTVKKGDFLKELTRRMVESSDRILQLGILKWAN